MSAAVSPTTFTERTLPAVNRYGFSIIPCDIRDKGPYGTNARANAFKEALAELKKNDPKARLKKADRERMQKQHPIKGIYSKTNTEVGVRNFAAAVSPEANYGICSDDRFIIFETDDRARLTDLLGRPIPNTFCVSARPNRCYFIFKQTERSRAVEGILEVAGLFELRNDGYCVGFGSIHPETGKEYRLVADLEPIPFPDWLLDALQNLHKNAPSSAKSDAVGQGDVDKDALEILLEALHKRGEPTDMLGLEGLTILSLHPTLKSLIAHLYQGPETSDEVADIVRSVGGEYGHRDPEDKDVEDALDWMVKRDRKPCFCKKCEDAIEANLPKSFVWPEPDEQGKPGRREEGPLWVFTEEVDFALFKHRVGQTPAWAHAAEWKDPEGWPELPANYEAWKASQPPTENGFKFPKVPSQVRDYTVLPLREKFDGWFGRGRVSIVGGSSGAGKTTLMCDLLDAQWRKDPNKAHFLQGHAGAGLRPLIVFADRGDLSNAETLERLGLTDKLPIAHIPVCWDIAATQRILELIENQNPLPEVVFVEGADTLTSDAGKVQTVAPFLSALQKIAAYYHIAIVLSVGAPKAKPREQHTLKRDRIFGSQIWPRMSDTIITLEAAGDGTNGHRDLTVQHRNAKPETFELEFQNGHLVERSAAANIDALDIWVSEQDPESWFTRKEALAAMKNGETGMGKTKVYDRLKEMLERGTLEKQWSKEKKKEEFRLWEFRHKSGLQTAEQRGVAVMEGTF